MNKKEYETKKVELDVAINKMRAWCCMTRDNTVLPEWEAQYEKKIKELEMAYNPHKEASHGKK